jgi:protein gp37
MGLDVWGPRAQRKPVKSVWSNVRKWNRAAKKAGERRRVFCMSMGDFFEPRPEVEAIRVEAWKLIRECDALDWQILTKAAEHIAEFLPPDWGEGWPHVWLGVSVENQEWADKRIPLLLAVPARVRFLSCEPLLGRIDLYLAGALRTIFWNTRVIGGRPPVAESVSWCIVGGESGPNHRPMDPVWAVALREQCANAGVPFFFKQASGARPGMGSMPDGSTPREWPRLTAVGGSADEVEVL